MTGKNTRPIVIKKVKKVVSGGHHGGAWKVAYADFMTALMAFFLLLWILSNADEERKQALADYFTPTEITLVNFGGHGFLQGSSIDGDDLTASEASQETSQGEEGTDAASAVANPWAELAQNHSEAFEAPDPNEFDQGRLEAAVDALAEHFSAFGENVMVRRDGDGIAIEIIDAGEKPLFASGSHQLTDANMAIVSSIAETIIGINGIITVTGHTDAAPYRNNGEYGNWELSADRANSTRRALIQLGLPDDRIAKVAGAAAMEPLIEGDPMAPGNRRVTVRIAPPKPVPSEGPAAVAPAMEEVTPSEGPAAE